MNHQTRVYDTMLEMLSNVDNPTPLVRLHRVVPYQHTKVYAKLEWYNPFGAVKDRVAANLIRDAEEHGRLAPHVRLVEPTSGNTGMGLAMIANAKGYGFTATLSNKIPAEKRASLRLFGTELIELEDELCPAPGAPEGAIALAAEIGERPGYFHLNQYKNPANPEAHYLTTGPEIWRQTDGAVTHFVCGLGTCGTITGTGRFLKEQRATIKVHGVHPVEGHDIPGVRSLRQLQQTALFFPKEYDELVAVHNQEAFELCRRLNQEESIIAGPLLQGPGAPAIIDVRSPEEYAEGHLPAAVNVPLGDLVGGWPSGLPEDHAAPIVTVCKVGERSLHGMVLLKSLGYQHVKSLRGGLNAWVEAGLPTAT